MMVVMVVVAVCSRLFPFHTGNLNKTRNNAESLWSVFHGYLMPLENLRALVLFGCLWEPGESHLVLECASEGDLCAL